MSHARVTAGVANHVALARNERTAITAMAALGMASGDSPCAVAILSMPLIGSKVILRDGPDNARVVHRRHQRDGLDSLATSRALGARAQMVWVAVAPRRKI